MIPISLVASANAISLPEYQVGKAYEQIEYPGIRQCFAVIGKRASFIIGTHVSPGVRADGINDTFAHLKELGGAWVSDWYVVGPCGVHFASGPNTVWKSVKDIRNTFKEQFGDTGANHHIMDITTLRNQTAPVDVDGAIFNVKIEFIDVKAERGAGDGGMNISYRAGRPMNGEWERLNPWLLKRF